MDLDVYVNLHRPEWQRLEMLVRAAERPGRLAPGEIDELVDLYQRAATHLSVVRTRTPDPQLVDQLSGLVTRARSATTGSGRVSVAGARRFLSVDFAAALYERRWWIAGMTAGFLVVAFAIGAWIANDPGVAHALVPASRVRALCDSEFADYYRSNPASSFAAQVWTNNALIAAGAVALGILLGLPTIYLMISNAVNVGVSGGYLATCGKSDQFWTLILPHGMLELTAVFIAGATGLRLGWADHRPGSPAPFGGAGSGGALGGRHRDRAGAGAGGQRTDRGVRDPVRVAAVGAADHRRAGRDRPALRDRAARAAGSATGRDR